MRLSAGTLTLRGTNIGTEDDMAKFIDTVEELRGIASSATLDGFKCHRAADEIERLRSLLKEADCPNKSLGCDGKRHRVIMKTGKFQICEWCQDRRHLTSRGKDDD